MYGNYVIHYSHVAGEINGYAHNFFNQKVRENQKFVSIFAHNMFSFDFFFVLKDMRLCVWRTKQLSIGGNNLTNNNFVNIENQVKFIHTIKFYQQPPARLAETMTDDKKSKQQM